MSLIGRIGQFFIFCGLIALAIFLATALSEDYQFAFCFSGVSSLILGILLARKGRPAPVETGRFRVIRTTKEKFARRHEQEKKG